MKKFGPKRTIGVSIFINALIIILTPPITYWGGASALIFTRVIAGCLQGQIQPAISSLLAHWIPPQERSISASIVYPGVYFGVMFSASVSGLILGSYHWSVVFYLFGGITMAWLILWITLCYDNPFKDPYITETELSFLRDKLKSYTQTKSASIPWKKIFTSKPFLALIVMQIGSDYFIYTIIINLPKYFYNVIKLPIEVTGFASSLGKFGLWIYCTIISWISDWMIKKELATITKVRKINGTIASMGSGILLMAASYAACDKVAVVVLFSIALSLPGSWIPAIKVNVLDLSPNYAATLMGLCNGIGALTGSLAPYILGALTPNQTLEEYRLVFWIVFIVLVISNLIFVKYGSGELQEWNDSEFEKNSKVKNEKILEETTKPFLN